MPFTWQQFDQATGSELPAEAKLRISRCLRKPTPETWANAKSIVVAPQLSMLGQTLWQCVQAVTLQQWPDGQVPGEADICLALCYAAGTPAPVAVRGQR
jgi:hypothetical protein